MAQSKLGFALTSWLGRALGRLLTQLALNALEALAVIRRLEFAEIEGITSANARDVYGLT